MAPPRKKAKTEKANEADPAVLAEAARRRLTRRAQGNLLLGDASSLGGIGGLPAALRKADGADIVKRNARRVRKYLLVFPGKFTAPQGSTVGTLRALDSRTPSLDVELDGGILRFRGALVFPKNALLTIRGRGGKVTVEDVFETLLVLAEWAWLGDLDSNPGDVPVPFPDELRKCVETDPAFHGARLQPVQRPRRVSERKPAKRIVDTVSIDSDSEGSDTNKKEEEVVVVGDQDGDDDEVVFANGCNDAEGNTVPLPPRRSSSRARQAVKYKDEDENAEGEVSSGDEADVSDASYGDSS